MVRRRVVAQRGQEGRGLPVAVRHFGLEPLPQRRPSAQRRHVGLGPGLVDEDQALGIDAVLILAIAPRRAMSWSTCARSARALRFGDDVCLVERSGFVRRG